MEQLNRPSIQFSKSRKDTCRRLTTQICLHIAVDKRVAIRKLLSSDYNTHKLAPQHGCHWSSGILRPHCTICNAFTYLLIVQFSFSFSKITPASVQSYGRRLYRCIIGERWKLSSDRRCIHVLYSSTAYWISLSIAYYRRLIDGLQPATISSTVELLIAYWYNGTGGQEGRQREKEGERDKEGNGKREVGCLAVNTVVLYHGQKLLH